MPGKKRKHEIIEISDDEPEATGSGAVGSSAAWHKKSKVEVNSPLPISKANLDTAYNLLSAEPAGSAAPAAAAAVSPVPKDSWGTDRNRSQHLITKLLQELGQSSDMNH